MLVVGKEDAKYFNWLVRLGYITESYGFLIVMRTTPIKPIGVFFVLIGLGPEHLSYGTCEVRNCVLKIFCGVRNISNLRLKKNIGIPCLLL